MSVYEREVAAGLQVDHGLDTGLVVVAAFRSGIGWKPFRWGWKVDNANTVSLLVDDGTDLVGRTVLLVADCGGEPAGDAPAIAR